MSMIILDHYNLICATVRMLVLPALFAHAKEERTELR